MAADELRGGVDDDVGAVLERTEEARRAERVVHDDGQAVLVGDLGDGVDVGDVGVGVAEGLEVDERRVVLDGTLDLVEVVGVNEGGLDAELGERVLEQVVGAAVDGLLGHDVVAGLGERLDGVGDGGGAGGNGKAGRATLERGDAVLEDALRGVGQAAVDVAGVSEAKAVGGVLGVAEDVARGLVDGHGARVGGGVGALLADVKLQGLEVEGLLDLGGDVGHGVPPWVGGAWASLRQSLSGDPGTKKRPAAQGSRAQVGDFRACLVDVSTNRRLRRRTPVVPGSSAFACTSSWSSWSFWAPPWVRRFVLMNLYDRVFASSIP